MIYNNRYVTCCGIIFELIQRSGTLGGSHSGSVVICLNVTHVKAGRNGFFKNDRHKRRIVASESVDIDVVRFFRFALLCRYVSRLVILYLDNECRGIVDYDSFFNCRIARNGRRSADDRFGIEQNDDLEHVGNGKTREARGGHL